MMDGSHLEKLRLNALECRLISDGAADPAQRELFHRLAAHLNESADRLQNLMAQGALGLGSSDSPV
jgi:hypothetical protein